MLSRKIPAAMSLAPAALGGCGGEHSHLQPSGARVDDKQMTSSSLEANFVEGERVLLDGKNQKVYLVQASQWPKWLETFEAKHPGERLVDTNIGGQATVEDGAGDRSTSTTVVTSFIAITRPVAVEDR